jgi:hypothetical protein
MKVSVVDRIDDERSLTQVGMRVPSSFVSREAFLYGVLVRLLGILRKHGAQFMQLVVSFTLTVASTHAVIDADAVGGVRHPDGGDQTREAGEEAEKVRLSLRRLR